MTRAVARGRSRTTVGLILAAAFAIAAALAALGVWQVQRLAWKLDLIERVERNLAASPVAAPGPASWSRVTSPATREYLRVRLTGRFHHDKETHVQAVTELGGGVWVLTPLETREGITVLVNRGFVPPGRRDPKTRAASAVADETTVTGLLRLSEPGGAFLRNNDPEANRWYSRDVAAIASAQGLAGTAPYFVDADATPNPGGWPVGGLTRVRFSNNHLVYALTWFVLALMALVGGGYVLRDALRRPNREPKTGQNRRDPGLRNSANLS